MTILRFSIAFQILLFALPLVAQSGSSGSLYRIGQSVKIGDTSAVRPTITEDPKVTATDSGFCVAWIDHREGKAAFAARLDRDGSILDPFGVSLGDGRDIAAAIPASGGCVVLWHKELGFVGRFLPSEPEKAIGPVFSLPAARRVLSADPDEIFLWIDRPGDNSLQLYDRGGRLLSRIDLDLIHPTLAVIDVVRVGNRRVMLASTQRPSYLRIYEINESFEVTFLGEIEERLPVKWNLMSAAATEEGLITVERPSEGVLDWIEYSLDGTLVSRGTSPIENVATLDRSERLPFRFEFIYDHRLYTSDPRSPGPVRVFKTLGSTSIDLDGHRRILVSSVRDPVSQLIFELDDFDGDGQLLAVAPERQRLIDSAVSESLVALVWTEENGPSARLFAGWFDTETMTMLRRLEIEETGSHIPISYDPPVGIEISGQRIAVAWIGSSESGEVDFYFRRASLTRGWLEEPQVIEDAQNGMNPRNLIRIGDEALLLFTSDESARRRVASIGFAGGLSIATIDAGTDEFPRGVARIDGGYLIATGELFPCRITCPGPPYSIGLVLDVYDEEFRYVTTLELPEPLSFVQEFGIEHRNGDLVVGTGGSSFYFEKLGPLVWAPAVETFVPGTDVEWFDDRFVLVRNERLLLWEAGAIEIDDFRPHTQRKRSPHPQTIVEDARAEDWWFPKSLHEIGGRLFVFTTAATPDAADGYVTRLRVHELILTDETRRGRAVSR